MSVLFLTNTVEPREILIVGDIHQGTTRNHTSHLKYVRGTLHQAETLTDAAHLKRKFDDIILSAFSQNFQNVIRRIRRNDATKFENDLVLSNNLLRETGRVIYIFDDMIGHDNSKPFFFRVLRLMQKRFLENNTYTGVDIDKLSTIARKHGFSLEQTYSISFDRADNPHLERWSATDSSLKHRYEALYVCLSKLGKKSASSNLVDHVMNDVNRAIENSGIVFTWTKTLITGKEKAIIFADSQNTSCVIKVPLSSIARQAENRQKVLRDYFRLQLRDLQAIIPESLGSGSVGNIDWYAESKVSGESLVEIISQSTRHTIIEQIGIVLRKLCPTDMSQSLKMQDGLYASLIEAPLNDIESVVSNREQMHSAHNAFRKWFSGRHLNIGPLHGDFAMRNIFCTHGNISGLIDWEDSNQHGISILDTINYLDSVQRACQPTNTIVDSLKLLTLHAWPNADEMTMLKQMFQYHNLKMEQLSSVAALYSITHLSDQVRMLEPAPDSRLANRCRNVVAFISSLPR